MMSLNAFLPFTVSARRCCIFPYVGLLMSTPFPCSWVAKDGVGSNVCPVFVSSTEPQEYKEKG